MHGRTTEIRHHSDEQIREALAFALALVDDLGLTDELRAPAFVKAVELRCAKQLIMEQIAPAIPNMVVPRGL